MGRSKDNTEGKKRKGYEEHQVWLKNTLENILFYVNIELYYIINIYDIYIYIHDIKTFEQIDIAHSQSTPMVYELPVNCFLKYEISKKLFASKSPEKCTGEE